MALLGPPPVIISGSTNSWGGVNAADHQVEQQHRRDHRYGDRDRHGATISATSNSRTLIFRQEAAQLLVKITLPQSATENRSSARGPIRRVTSSASNPIVLSYVQSAPDGRDSSSLTAIQYVRDDRNFAPMAGERALLTT